MKNDIKELDNLSKSYKVVDRITNGEYLKEAVKLEGLTISVFSTMLTKSRELAVSYAHAQEISADILADEALEAADSDLDPAKVRNMMQIRQWLASKRNTKRYGDRIDLNVSQTVSINSALDLAKSRLIRPIRDQIENSGVQTVDFIEPAQYVSVDRQSDSSEKPAIIPNFAPDIFS